ncbi:GntR family transcriptional regulator [Paenibacillus sambharensis]|uniref:GntR family transcriptional regulator n=1 Tax=Paenibacillus sambharensis TaxID=1803190 RepID=A0A2W1L2B1_9BACL|nr:GntR family transcriptional regulator [Paenibacillus sambharensis]PZD93203.1 GntR family transcriptional regulator [Paenibacillus sambharensis]
MGTREMPKYMQLRDEILVSLQAGKWKPNEQMPSEHELAAKYVMSRQTVRQALGELEKDGWLYRLQGKGTFVSPRTGARPQREVQTVGMITTYISDYIFPHIVRGAEAVLRSRGYGLLLSSTDNDKARETQSLRMMLGQPLSGLIVEPTKSAQGNPNLHEYLNLQDHRVPFLMINERYSDLDCPCLKVDDEAGGFKAAEHLIQLGHRRIAGFFKTDDLQGTNRMKGFVRAHRQYQVPMTPDAVTFYTSEEKEVKPVATAKAMLSRTDRPTAFVCYNDELALTLLGAVRELGLSVPDDLSMIGFDDSTLAVASEVKLTTLTHPKTEMGAAAAELLLDLIEGRRTMPAEDILYEPELIIRDSTKEPQLVL